jgi:hypothetical protein
VKLAAFTALYRDLPFEKMLDEVVELLRSLIPREGRTDIWWA